MNMTSGNGFNIFERSTREPDLETSARHVPTLRHNIMARFPRVAANLPDYLNLNLDPFEDDPSTHLLGCPYPQYSNVGVPVPANGRPVDSEETEDLTMHESHRCRGCFDNYKDTVKNFRNSYYIHILHFLLCHIPISAIVIGLLYLHQCPDATYLPGLVTAVGVVGTVLIVLWTVASYRKYSETPCSNLHKSLMAMFTGLLLTGTMFEICLVVELSPSFTQSLQDRCHEFFYTFLFYKEIATAMALLLTAFIYIPGSGLYTFCRECPMPLPASAFFNFR